MKSEKIKKVGATDRAIEYILHLVIDRKLEFEDSLPSERDLAEIIGVSRTSVRKAIEYLKYEGLVETRPNSGIYIKKNKMVMDLTDLMSFSEAMRRKKISYETRLISSGIIEADKSLTQIFNIRLGDPVYQLIRLRILDERPYLYQIVYLDYGRFKGIEGYDFSKESQYQIMEKEYGVKIIHGEERIDTTYVSSLEAKTLKIEEGSPAFFLVSQNYDQDDRLTEYTKQIVRYDMITYQKKLNLGDNNEK